MPSFDPRLPLAMILVVRNETALLFAAPQDCKYVMRLADLLQGSFLESGRSHHVRALWTFDSIHLSGHYQRMRQMIGVGVGDPAAPSMGPAGIAGLSAGQWSKAKTY